MKAVSYGLVRNGDFCCANSQYISSPSLLNFPT